MEAAALFFVHQPAHVLGVAIGLLLVWLAERPRSRAMLLVALAWLTYAAWEWLVLMQSPDANIRVDLLFIWPFLGLLTLWAFLKLGLTVFVRKKAND